MASSDSEQGVISTEQAARLLMVSDERVRQLAKEGWIPKHGRGKFNLVAAVQGYIKFLRDEDRRSSKSASASRATDARAREIELRIAREERTLIKTEEATAALDAVVGAVLSEVKGLPARHTRDRDARRALENEIRATLDRISDRLGEAVAALEAGGDALAADAEDDAG